jgi:acetyl esterase/lipase
MAPSTSDETADVSSPETNITHDQPETSDLDRIASAFRGNEILGLDVFTQTRDALEDFPAARVEHLMAAMNNDVPTGGYDISYGDKDTQHLRFWKAKSSGAPVVIFVHGGSWQIGTYLDSVGSAKVNHLLDQGYAFASVNFSLIPSVTLEEQVQEVAHAIGYLARNAAELGIDSQNLVLMGHSSGAHVASLLGTDSDYLIKAGVNISSVRGVIAVDGSNYNAMADFMDSPGPVANNLAFGLGREPARLRAMSPTCHTRGANAGAFLLLHAQRDGGIRQAVEFAAVLEAAGTDVELHVFEGRSFEGHMQMLLRLGEGEFPATGVMDGWLRRYVPVGLK